MVNSIFLVSGFPHIQNIKMLMLSNHQLTGHSKPQVKICCNREQKVTIFLHIFFVFVFALHNFLEIFNLKQKQPSRRNIMFSAPISYSITEYFCPIQHPDSPLKLPEVFSIWFVLYMCPLPSIPICLGHFHGHCTIFYEE